MRRRWGKCGLGHDSIVDHTCAYCDELIRPWYVRAWRGLKAFCWLGFKMSDGEG